jgi:hypothetical protein
MPIRSISCALISEADRMAVTSNASNVLVVVFIAELKNNGRGGNVQGRQG